MKISGTLDIECAHWDRFAVGATYQPTQGGDGDGETTVHRSIASLVDLLLAKRGTWWAHAGGAYDFLAVVEEMRRRGIPCSLDLAGARISRLVGGGIVLRDSWPLVPMSLDVAAALAGERAPVLGLPCRCGERCGGYCSIREHDPRRCVADYCAADARVLYRVLEAVRQLGSDLGLTMRGTIGGTAWATARDTLALPNSDLHPTLWRLARGAYYGGRVAVVRPLAEGPGSHWDLSSAYPAALATVSVPIGKHAHHADRSAAAQFSKGAPGVYAGVMRVPEVFMPPLPSRKEGGRITFPIGPVPGVWTLSEIRTAMARGAIMQRVDWSITWERDAMLFADLVEKWWRRRASVGKNSPAGQWMRLLSNSLPGKLAEDPERRAARMFPDKIRHCRAKRPCTVIRCSGACGAWSQLDTWGQIWGVPFYRPAPSAHIHWAAYVTASARERWLVGAESQGVDLVYGDTDSLWTTSRLAPYPSGVGLGRWEYKHGWRSWECVGPRQYRFLDDKNQRVLRTAGAHVTNDEWNRGEGQHARGVLSFKEAARAMDGNRGLFQRRIRQWTLPGNARATGVYGDRMLDARSGVTLPMAYGEAEKAARRG